MRNNSTENIIITTKQQQQQQAPTASTRLKQMKLCKTSWGKFYFHAVIASSAFATSTIYAVILVFD